MPRIENNNQNETAQRMIGLYLQRRALVAPPVVAGEHMDEDSLSAFIEGRLSEREAQPIISHLIGCGSCRRVTTQLIRLEEAIGDMAPVVPPVVPREPSRIRRLLDELAARVLPAADDAAVFAYHAPAEDFATADSPETPEEERATQATEGGAKTSRNE